MVRHCIAALIALCIAATTAVSAELVRPRAADEYRLELSVPPNCATYTGTATPHRFGGELLAIWEMSADKGKGILYAVGTRREGNFIVDQIADSFEQFMTDAKIDGERFENFTVMGRPAMKFAMRGPGTGQVISGLTGETGGAVPTYMEVVLTTNQWVDGSGTDFIQFVMACPEASKDAVGAAFKTLVHGTTLRGQYDPTSDGRNGADTTAPKDDEPKEEAPAPGGSAARVARVTNPATSHNPGPSATADAPDVMFGSLYAPTGPVPTPVSIQLLRSEQKGAVVRWSAPPEEKTDVYICVWPAMRATWIIPGDAFRNSARRTSVGYELSFSDELAPYLGNWDALWTQ